VKVEERGKNTAFQHSAESRNQNEWEMTNGGWGGETSERWSQKDVYDSIFLTGRPCNLEAY
jgi:hypothetical protein